MLAVPFEVHPETPELAAVPLADKHATAGRRRYVACASKANAEMAANAALQA
jgi:hypothetical protein